jgi:hypothetical protein
MRLLKYCLIGIAAICVAGYLYLRQMGIDNKGATISQTISLAFARKNLFHIADAEREQVTAFSECYSLEQLISMAKVDANQQGRGGYSFEVSCSGDGTEFTVTATHAPSPPGSIFHWPILAIDQSMTLREVY